MDTKTVTVGPAAKRARLSIGWIRRLCDTGQLSVTRGTANERRIPLAALEQLIEARAARRQAQDR